MARAPRKGACSAREHQEWRLKSGRRRQHFQRLTGVVAAAGGGCCSPVIGAGVEEGVEWRLATTRPPLLLAGGIGRQREGDEGTSMNAAKARDGGATSNNRCGWEESGICMFNLSLREASTVVQGLLCTRAYWAGMG
uniref:Uncharacterized protein n=1 Tax=Oryza barthii TaxID=65489 RepID=A0A0D3H4M8_9ORYZ